MIEQRPWNTDAEQRLLSSAGDHETLADIANEVRANVAQLWRIETPEAQGWLVTRVEIGPYGLELVVVLGAGKGARPVIQWVKRLAQDHGIKRIRTHIQRPGLIRMYQRAGFQPDHTVMVFNDGQ